MTDAPPDCVVRPTPDGAERWCLRSRVYQRTAEGVPVEDRPFNDLETAWADGLAAARQFDADRRAARRQARAAIAANRDYLRRAEEGTLTAADRAAQLTALTAQLAAALTFLVADDSPPPADPQA